MGCAAHLPRLNMAAASLGKQATHLAPVVWPRCCTCHTTQEPGCQRAVSCTDLRRALPAQRYDVAVLQCTSSLLPPDAPLPGITHDYGTSKEQQATDQLVAEHGVYKKVGTDWALALMCGQWAGLGSNC
jgi:hypothetical protein